MEGNRRNNRRGKKSSGNWRGKSRRDECFESCSEDFFNTRRKGDSNFNFRGDRVPHFRSDFKDNVHDRFQNSHRREEFSGYSSDFKDNVPNRFQDFRRRGKFSSRLGDFNDQHYRDISRGDFKRETFSEDFRDSCRRKSFSNLQSNFEEGFPAVYRDNFEGNQSVKHNVQSDCEDQSYNLRHQGYSWRRKGFSNSSFNSVDSCDKNAYFRTHSQLQEMHTSSVNISNIDEAVEDNFDSKDHSVNYVRHDGNFRVKRHEIFGGKKGPSSSNSELQETVKNYSAGSEFGDYSGEKEKRMYGKQNNIDYQRKLSQHLDVKSILNDTFPDNSNERIELLNILRAASNKIMQKIEPADIISDCREKVTNWTEKCLTEHHRKMQAFAQEDEEVLREHYQNLKQQSINFEKFVHNIRSQFMDIKCSSPDSVVEETNGILQRVKSECKRFEKSLPAYALINDIELKVSQRQVTIIALDAVYFGNMVIPIYMQELIKCGLIAVCEPNETLAINFAKNCSVLSQQPLGSNVGFDLCESQELSEGTKILYTTVQKLLVIRKTDPVFSKFSLIIFDEFLKRTVEDDLLLDAVRKCLSVRNDLKVILLVANVKIASKYEKYFSKTSEVSVLETPNLILPVSTIWKEAVSTIHDDYITEVVDTCLGIHVVKDSDTHAGDILAFLPNDQDAIKASVLLKKKLSQYHADAECLVVSEESKNKKILQIIDWEKPSKRRILFAVMGYEIVTIPTVRYVVDSGRVEQVLFDPGKNVDVVVTSFVSQSIAKMRKNCSGRSLSGICYRLYNKNNFIKDMNWEELPEFLSGNPFNSLIKLFQYDPDEALNFEPVEPMPENVKERSLQSLRDYGCIKNNHLTILGENIVKLPFPLKYSKLLVLGINRGYPFEVAILVAFFLVKGHVFWDEDAQNLQKEIDAAKLHLLQHDSETFTYLNIYKQWIENDYEKPWCVNHHLNVNYLRQVQIKVAEVIDIVNKCLKEKIPQVMSEHEDLNTLQEIIFESFQDNFCVYTGHNSSGYRSVNAKCIVFPHPSSSICQKELLPQFIVYDNLFESVNSYITHITALPESMVLETIKNGNVQINQGDLFEMRLVPAVIDKVGVMIIKRVLFGKKGKRLKDLEEHIKKETQSDLIVIEPSVEKGNVTVYALPNCVRRAEGILRKFLQDSLELLHVEEETLVLKLEKGGASVPINITWAKGGRVTHLDIGTNEITVVELDVNRSKKETISEGELPTTQSSIKLTWLHRPCRGYGFVTFKSYDDFRIALKLTMKCLKIKDAFSEIQRSKKNDFELYISGLSADTMDKDIEDAFKRALGEDIGISRAYVVRNTNYEMTEEDVGFLSNYIKQKSEELLNASNLDVTVQLPDNTAVLMTAHVNVNITDDLENGAHILSSKLKINDCNVQAKPLYISTLFCKVEVLKSLEKVIFEVLESLMKYLQATCEISPDEDLFTFKADVYDNCTARLELFAYNKEVMNILRKTVCGLIEGVIVTEKDIKGLHKLFSHGGHIWLRRLEKSENVYVLDEYKSKTIRLYGSQEVCDIAKLRIQEFLNSEEESVKTINLSNGNNPSIILKAVIEVYGVNLEKFIELHHLRSAELNIRCCQLTLHGSRESVEEAENELEKLAERFDSSIAQDIHDQQEICPICTWPAITLTYRLESCGHLYCAGCIKGVVLDAKFPLRCCAEDCDKELVLEDVRKLLDYEQSKIDDLLSASLKDYISQKRKQYSYCPSPDCSMFFDKNSISGTCCNCPLCHNDICIKCNTIYHQGYTCDMYQGMKKDGDYSFQVWLKDGNRNCKRCPVCKVAIEKTMGCNHMKCKNCNGHFCWLCLTAFPTDNQVYNHMPFCKKNQSPYV